MKESQRENVVVFELREATESTETLVKGLFEERLELKERRLGKKMQDQGKIRPVVVSFVAGKDKERGLKAEAKLRGSEVYINQDMTKDQISLCKVLRKRKAFLI